MTGSATSSSTSSSTTAHPPIKRQMTGIKGAPVPKRQVAMPTGGRTVLGETQPKLTAQMTGRSAFGGGGGGGNLSLSGGSNSSKLVGAGGSKLPTSTSSSSMSSGMRIPAGWGGGEDAGLDPRTLSTTTSSSTTTAAFIQPQPTGGFRPRGSNMSSSSSIAGR